MLTVSILVRIEEYGHNIVPFEKALELSKGLQPDSNYSVMLAEGDG
jgi:hypothetical protein